MCLVSLCPGRVCLLYVFLVNIECHIIFFYPLPLPRPFLDLAPVPSSAYILMGILSAQKKEASESGDESSLVCFDS